VYASVLQGRLSGGDAFNRVFRTSAIRSAIWSWVANTSFRSASNRSVQTFETVLSVQEMNVDSDAVGHSADSAFQDGVDSQFPGRANRIVRLLLKARHRGASGYPEAVYPPAGADEFLGKTVDEVVAIVFGAVVYERHDG